MTRRRVVLTACHASHARRIQCQTRSVRCTPSHCDHCFSFDQHRRAPHPAPPALRIPDPARARVPASRAARPCRRPRASTLHSLVPARARSRRIRTALRNPCLLDSFEVPRCRCVARTGKMQKPGAASAGHRAHRSGGSSIRLRIASRVESPLPHVLLPIARHAGAARARADANAREQGRRMVRSERDVLRHAVLLSSCPVRARGAHERCHHVAGGGLPKGKGIKTFRQFRRLTRRNVFRSGCCYVVAAAPARAGDEFGEPHMPRRTHEPSPRAANPWRVIGSMCPVRVMVMSWSRRRRWARASCRRALV